MESNENEFNPQQPNENRPDQHEQRADQSSYGHSDQHVTNSSFKSKLELTIFSIEHLREIAKWSRFLAIIGFVGIGLNVLGVGFFFLLAPGMAPFAAEGFNMFAGFAGFIVFVFIAALYFLPILWLYRFGDNLKKAIDMNNSAELESAFGFLKKHYKYVGILVICLILFYGLMIVFGMLGGIFAAMGTL